MESVRLREYERKTQMRANELELFKDSFVLVPYQVSGYIDVTNRGITNSPQRPQDYETFKRVWTGNDAVVINWKNSLSYNQQPDTPNKDYVVKYKLGEVLLGRIEEATNDVSIENDESFSQYKSQQSEGILRFRVDKRFNLDDTYQFYFWKVPEMNGSTLYRVERLEKDYVGNELVGYVLTLKTLNQDISNTGRAKQQNVMPSAPGQGYLECIVKDKNWPNELGEDNFNKLVEGVDYYKFYDRYITADFQKTLNRPVYSVIVKILGNGILNSVSFFGRPVERGDSFTKFRSPRLIFPINLSNPSTPNFYNTQNNESNFFFGNFKPQLLYHKEWRDWISGLFNPTNTYKYEGVVEFDGDALRKTNPLENEQYKNNLYGDLKDGDRLPWSFTLTSQTINTSTILGTTPTYDIPQVDRIIHDHMFDNYWTQKNMKTLPMTSRSSLSYGNSLPSLLGGGIFGTMFKIFKLAMIGMSWSKDRFTNKANFVNYRGLASAPLIDLNLPQYGQPVGENNKVMLNVFDNNANSPSAVFFSNQTMNISFQADLTDRFIDEKTPNLNKKTLSTLNIGQKTFEDGTPIKSDNSQYLLSGGTKLITAESGYIIDYIQIQAMTKSDISIEFLDEVGNVVWTGIYQSEGKWTDSFREVWTEKFTSVFGRENVFGNEPQPYPKEVEPIRVERPKFDNIEIDSGYGNRITQYFHMNWGDDPIWDFTSQSNNFIYDSYGQTTKSKARWLNGDNENNSGNVVDWNGVSKKLVTTLNQIGLGSWEDFLIQYGGVYLTVNLNIEWENIYLNINNRDNLVEDKQWSGEMFSRTINIDENAKLDTWYGLDIDYTPNVSVYGRANVGTFGVSNAHKTFDRIEYKFTQEGQQLFIETRYRRAIRGNNGDATVYNDVVMYGSGKARIGLGGGSFRTEFTQQAIIITRQRT